MTQASGIVEIPVSDAGRCDAYVAVAPHGRAPVVVLIPPIFGATPGIREFAQNLAAQGLTAVVPDLFWRIMPGPLGYEGVDRDKAQDRYKRFDVAEGLADLREIIGWCRDQSVNGKVGVVGLCFGGRYAVLAAADLSADAAVSYHGTFIGRHLDALSRIQCPTGLHFGEADPHVPMTEVSQIINASSGNPNIEIVTYPDAPHGFIQQDRPSFRLQAARPAWAAGLSTLKKGLA